MILNKMKFKHNQGLALPVILILLLVMTILGVTSLSNSTLQERMVQSQALSENAFNLAETTLREAELHLQALLDDNPGGFTKGLLEDQDGNTFRFFGDDSGNLTANPHWVPGFPALSQANPGDTCSGGYCTPLEHDTSGTATVERWLDPTVWNDPLRHRIVENYTDDIEQKLLDQNILETPKYIVEFLGQIPMKERNSDIETSEIQTLCYPDLLGAPNNAYPYCPFDAYLFRITARVIAGIGQRESEVMLQTTLSILPTETN